MMFDHLLQDLSHAFRVLRGNPGATTIAILVLAAGIGPNTAIFSIVDKVLLQPLPYPQPDRLLQLIVASPMGNATRASVPKFNAWREDRGAFEYVAAFTSPEPLVLAAGSVPEVVAGMRVSADYFPVFGHEPAIGRTFTRADDVPRGPAAALISHGLWQRRFGRDRDVVGRPIRLDGRSFEVIGVMASDAPDDGRTDVWLPLQADPDSTDHSSRLQVVARMRPGVTLANARLQTYSSAGAFHRRFPAVMGPREHFGVMWLRDVVVGDARPALLFLLCAVTVVLLIACANVANLLLAQGSAREREFSLRAALGARPSRLLAQVLTENVLLTAAGGVLGVAIAWGGLRWLLSLDPAYLARLGPSARTIAVDGRVLGFTAVLLVVTTMLFGLYPALRAARRDLTSMFGSGGSQSTAGRSRSRLRGGLVVAQMACALVLLLGAGLFIESFVATRTVEPGFQSANVLTVEMPIPGPRFADTAAVARFVETAENRLRTLPDVAAAAATSSLPLEPGATLPFSIDRRPLLQSPFHGTANWRRVSRAYFDVFRIPLLAGRPFSPHDTAGARPVAIVNESMARKFWPGGLVLALDERITVAPAIRPDITEPSRVIVGIVGNVRDTSLTGDLEPIVYVPIGQVSDGMTAFENAAYPLQWVVRGAADVRRLAPAIGRELEASSGGAAIGRVQTMDEIVALSTARADFNTTVLAAFATLALSLACVGLYGVMAQSIQQRTREIGIRMALGAAPSSVRGMVLRQGLRLTTAGVAIGTIAGILLMRTAAGVVFGARPINPLLFCGVALLLNGVAVLAILLSARRATSVRPTEALRHT